MKVEVKELKINNELQKKINMTCRFACVKPIILKVVFLINL